MLAALWQDLRIGARNLLASPRFALVASLTLALGVGVNGAVFSVVNGTMLNVVPWDASRMVIVASQKQGESQGQPVSSARYQDWREQSQSFRELLAVRYRPFVLTEREPSEAIGGVEVSPETFEAIQLRMVLGRGLGVADAAPDAPPQVVLSHALWTQRFGGARDLVGRTIEIEEQAVVVAGVLAEDQWYPSPDAQILAPLRLSQLQGPRDQGAFQVFGILKPDVTLERARNELDTISQRLAAEYPDTDKGWTVRVRNMLEVFAGGGSRAALLLLMSAVGAVLLVACINVANLLLARGVARQKELAIRCSVGATRGRIVVQLLAESLILALVALPISLLLARVTLDFMLTRAPVQFSWIDQVFRFDAPVWLFMTALTLATVLIFGLMPALRASRLDLSSVIKEGGDRGSSGVAGGRLRAALTVAQLSAALALLVVSALSIQSFSAVMSDEIGIDFDRLFLTSIALPDARYASPEQWNHFQEQLTARLETLDGVGAAGVTDTSPISSQVPSISIAIEGTHASKPDSKIEARISAVSPGYLRATGVRLQLGRTFSDADDASAVPVALVNQAMVRAHFGGESPLGDRISTPQGQRQIVGVLSDIKRFGLRDGKPVPEIFVPFAQKPSAYINVVARTRGDPLALGPSVRSELDALDHLLPIFQLTSVRKQLQESIWPLRFLADLMLLLAVLAVSLASVGVYGVVSYSVAQRLQEFAIRSALGAAPRQIVILVLRGALWLAAIGIALGLVLSVLSSAALKATQLLSRNVDPSNPTVFIAASLLLGAIILIASAIPAYRSSRAEPSQALRAQ